MRSSIRRPLILATVGLVGIGRLTPQEPADQVFRVETALMQVEVKVTEGKKTLLEGLTKEDFTLYENGEPQEIVSLDYIDYPRENEPAAGPEVETRPSTESLGGSAPQSTANETRILITTYITEDDRPRVVKAIRGFIENDLRPSVKVSLGGSPFISDKKLLLRILDHARLTDPMTPNDFAVFTPNLVQELQQFDDANLEAGLQRGPRAEPASAATRMDEQITRTRMHRYVDIINALAVYPGKKMVVLFTRALPMGLDSFSERFVGIDSRDLLARLRAESMRARISLYVVDSQGLRVGGTISTAEFSQNPELLYTSQQASLGVPEFVLGTTPLTGGLNDIFRAGQYGLKALAQQTGGVAVTDTNDIGKIFEHVYDDLGGYYLIGYYPPKRDDPKRLRKVRIEVNQPTARLSYRKGFYDDEEFRRAMQAERRRQLEEALGEARSETTASAPLRALEAYKAAFDEMRSDVGSMARAAESLQEATGLYPGFAAAWNLLGYAQEDLGDTAGARESYQKAADSDAEYLNPLSHLARIEIEQQAWDAAKERASKLTDKDAERPDAHFYLATAEFNLGDLEAAKTAAEAALAQDGEARFVQAHQLMGLIHAQQGEFKAAADSYHRYLAAKPDAADAEAVRQQIGTWETARDLYQLRADVRAEDWESAAGRADHLAEIDPGLTEARFYSTLAHFRLGDFDEAVDRAKGVRSAPDSARYPLVHRMLGTIYSQRGDIRAAAKEYRDFLAVQPQVPDAAELSAQLTDWEKQLRFERKDGPRLRVVNPRGKVNIQVVARGGLRMQPSSPDRAVSQGDVVMVQEPGVTTLECRPKDGARVDLDVTLPYGFGIDVETDSGTISINGLIFDAKLSTGTGDVVVAVPWVGTLFSMTAENSPSSVSIAPGTPVTVTDSGSTGNGWALNDSHDSFTVTYGSIKVMARAPGRVVLEDIAIPEDSPVKMPIQAPAVLQSILEGDPRRLVPVRSDSPPSLLRGAESPEEDSTVRFSSDVRMVNLSVSITDANGLPLLGLAAMDFEIVEDGVEQKISSVTAGDAPFNLVILLDMSSSTMEERAGMKLAARRFISTAKPNDRVAMYVLGNELFSVVSLLTVDRDQLATRIDAIPAMAGGSPLYDAIVLAYAEELPALGAERNALLILSDGVDNQFSRMLYPAEEATDGERKKKRKRPVVRAHPGVLASASRVAFSDLLEAARKVETLIYPFLLGHDSPRRHFPGDIGKLAKSNMEKLAAASGGRVFTAKSVNDIDPFVQVAKELRSVYTLAYYPKDQAFDGSWRKLEVKVARPEANVRTRAGYVAR